MSVPVRVSARTAPDDRPDDRYPVPPPPCCAGRDGAVGRRGASAAGRVRAGKRARPPLGPRCDLGCLAAPELSARGGDHAPSRPPFRPGADIPSAPRRGTGPRRPQARAPRGRPLRPLGPSVRGFSGSGCSQNSTLSKEGARSERASTAQAKITGMSLSLESKTARRPLPSRCAV